MGDRGAIVIRERGAQCVLYTHWGGYRIQTSLAEGLRKALSHGRSYNDPDYLRRILFDTLLANEPRTDTLGYGIGHYIPDDLNYPPVIVDVKDDRLEVDGQHVRDWLAARKVTVE